MIKDKLLIYRTRDKQWRWRRRSSSGDITGWATESYHNLTDAVHNIVTTQNLDNCAVWVEDQSEPTGLRELNADELNPPPLPPSDKNLGA